MTAPTAGSSDTLAVRIIAAALDEFTEYGLRRVKVEDIARRAGVHRVTVYTRFATKDDIIAAAAIAWADRFFTNVASTVAHLPNPADRLVEGFTLTMQTIRTDALIMRLLRTEPDLALPFVTINGGPALAAVRSFFTEQLADADLPDPEGASELAARIGLSFLLTPDSHFKLRTAKDVRAFARRYLAPLLAA